MSRRPSHKSLAAAAPSAALPPAPAPATFKLPPLDPALLASALSNLQDYKRGLIHSFASVGDRIPNLFTFLSTIVNAIDLARDTIAFTLASLPEEARP